MVSVLEKLSREFGQKGQDETREGRHENNVSAQPSCRYTAPSEEQISCSGVSVSIPRESTFEERLVDKLLEAQQKQFQELRCFVKKEIAATNKRIDDMVISDDDSDLSSDNENSEPSLKRQKMSDDSDQTGTAVAMLSHTNDDMNGVRRTMIKPSLNTEYRALCSSQNPITANLFGDNIAEQLKTIQEVNKVGKKINNDEKNSKAFSYNKCPRVPFLGSRNSWASGSRKRGASSSGRHPVGMNRHQKKQRGAGSRGQYQ
ncbi:hypothetical protein FSP39_004968 [Pinctada imbricata]|uniref:Uncharacterized protein n=1 Tax=Pinctada imbricata TaxID=66713 RepID=A0AA89CD52_PINIB|nr:hypothetical protein FSP39_004968 [Pinctada imbricata]